MSNKTLTAKYRFREIVLSAVLACVVCTGFSLRLSAKADAPAYSGVLYVILNSLKTALSNPLWLSLVVVGLLGYTIWRLLPSLKVRELRWIIPLAIVAGASFVLAESFYIDNSLQPILRQGVAIIVAIKVAAYAISFVFLLTALMRINVETVSNNSRLKSRTRRTLIRCGCLLLCWLPIMIALLPGCANPDTRDMIAQVLGNKELCWSFRHVTPVNPNMIVNNHHPVAYTAIVGAFVKLGDVLGSHNLSFGLYCGIQCLLLAFALSWQVSYLEERCKSSLLPKAAVVFCAINPVIPAFGMAIMKDTPYSILTLLLIAQTFSLLDRNTEHGWRKLVLFGITLFFWMLLRNNGLYILVVLAPALIAFTWRNRRLSFGLAATMLITAVVFQGGVQTLLFGSLGISQGGQQEALSLPFMQTARLIRDHPESITAEDEAMLLEVFETPNHSLGDIVAAYDENPARADTVKFMFNNERGPARLREYLAFWMRGWVRNPTTYLQALMNLDYGWIYLDSTEDGIYYSGITDKKIKKLLPDFKMIRGLDEARATLGQYIGVLDKLPFTFWMVELSFYTWLYLVCFILMVRRRKWREIISFGYVFLNYLICFIGPVAYMRYALPALICTPMLLLYTFSVVGDGKRHVEPDGLPARSVS